MQSATAVGGPSFHLFVYESHVATGDVAALLDGCTRVGTASVPGTLYEIDDSFPALMLAGSGQVDGEVWRCPSERLLDLDAHESVRRRLYRRVGVQAGEWACWTYVAGPALAPWIADATRALHAG